MITKIQIFDLDDTILRIPTFSAISPIEANKKYSSDPYKFYDSSESLDYKKYNIQLIEPVYEEYLRYKDSSYQVLITHRVESLSTDVEFILNSIDMGFNEIALLGRKSPKAEIVNNLIHMMDNITEIEIFEDSIAQIDEYQQKLKLKPGQKLTFWLVDKSKLFKLGSISILESKRIKLKTI